ncbi:MAG: LON peptidase substrate-binding domain-containing protein, partial [Candidatus Aureabacteria bacterium]|nr:LON peptidase substrate-binding domain-containing protein [Candidatus Auribacterota bacterium]
MNTPVEPQDNMHEQEGQVAIPREIGILPLRDTVIFPFMITPLLVGREKSIRLINEALSGEKIVGLLTQQKTEVEDPHAADLYRCGTICKIHKMIRYPDQRVNIIVQGLKRFRVEQFIHEDPYFKAAIQPVDEAAAHDMETQALTRS